MTFSVQKPFVQNLYPCWISGGALKTHRIYVTTGTYEYRITCKVTVLRLLKVVTSFWTVLCNKLCVARKGIPLLVPRAVYPVSLADIIKQRELPCEMTSLGLMLADSKAQAHSENQTISGTCSRFVSYRCYRKQ